MVPSFHTVDRQTHRRVMLVGFLFCAAFVVISFLLRPQPEQSRVLVKADRLVRTAGAAKSANQALNRAWRRFPSRIRGV
jgi:hypothetical protein